jgi:hypothetical protein
MNFSLAMAFSTAMPATDSATTLGHKLQNFRRSQKCNSQCCSFDALRHIKECLSTTSCHSTYI